VLAEAFYVIRMGVVQPAPALQVSATGEVLANITIPPRMKLAAIAMSQTTPKT
jgi:hypothetical protein